MTVLFMSASVFPAAAHAGSPVVPVVSFSDPQQLPESIAVDRQGNLYLSLAPLKEILKVAPDGTQSTLATFSAGTRSLGVRLDASGNVDVALVGSGVWQIPAGGGTPVQVASIPGFPNALAFDHRGNLYVSDSIAGVIYRVASDGSISIWSASPLLLGTTAAGPCGLPHPSGLALGANGFAFDERGDDVFVSNTTLGTVVRIPVNGDGTAGTASVLSGPDCRLWGADGLAMDRRGNVYVAANAEQNIVRVDPGGGIHVIASSAAGDPLFSPSDIAFGTGRADREQIFITNFAAFTGGVGAGVATTDVGIPGLRLP